MATTQTQIAWIEAMIDVGHHLLAATDEDIQKIQAEIADAKKWVKEAGYYERSDAEENLYQLRLDLKVIRRREAGIYRDQERLRNALGLLEAGGVAA